MVDWLERAKREFEKSAGRVTANTADRNPMAVMAVPELSNSEISLGSIGSNDSALVTEFQEIESAIDDDRRTCTRCANLTERGLCLAAWRGEIVASRRYEPINDIPRRCEGYVAGADDLDRRPGRERWPGLTDTKGTK